MVAINRRDDYTVNGLAIWECLDKPDDQFRRWVKKAIKRQDLKEGQDFAVSTQIGSKSQGGRPTKDCLFTIESAKRIVVSNIRNQGLDPANYMLTGVSKHIQVTKPQGGYDDHEVEDIHLDRFACCQVALAGDNCKSGEHRLPGRCHLRTSGAELLSGAGKQLLSLDPATSCTVPSSRSHDYRHG